MKKIFFVAMVVLALLNTGCEKCPICPEEDDGKVHLIYPANGQEGVVSSPELQWCESSNTDEYELHIEWESTVSGLTASLDTIVSNPRLIIRNLVFHDNGSVYMFSLSPEQWYSWKVRRKVNNLFSEWSNEFRFKTNSLINNTIGTYTVSKYNYWIGFHHIFGNCRNGQVCKSYVGQSEITISKNPNGSGIKVVEKDVTTTLDQIYDNDTYFAFTFTAPMAYGRYMDATFNPSLDSFTVEFDTRSVDWDRESGILFVGAMPR